MKYYVLYDEGALISASMQNNALVTVHQAVIGTDQAGMNHLLHTARRDKPEGQWVLRECCEEKS